MGTLSDFEHLHEHIEKMWERLAGGHPGQPRFQPPVIEPPADVYQTAGAVVVVLEIAGMRGQDVELSIADGRLTVRGEKTDVHHHGSIEEHRGREYIQMEIARGPFARTVPLPALVDGDHVSVRYEDGLLQITLPKRQAVAARRIKVSVREG
ncbi:MAG: Hsp20/alpha crystallin family protein [Chloroflexi bacterium]|nr:Hsp20/alpha crystallin family protein [Chloroflexota bacterium]